jgi:hypothetical protein
MYKWYEEKVETLNKEGMQKELRYYGGTEYFLDKRKIETAVKLLDGMLSNA